MISVMLLSGCNNSSRTDPAENNNSLTIARDTVPKIKTETVPDEHGCLTTTGETWSIVRKSCIRLADIGIKMEPQDPALDKTKVAFLVFTDDKLRVEIFLPTQKNTVIIRRSSAEGEPGRWANGPLSLSESNGTYSLGDEGKLLYQGTTGK
ncbi:MAG: hypothetical protein ACRDEB_09355 [Chitinophagaceae bacterium]